MNDEEIQEKVASLSKIEEDAKRFLKQKQSYQAELVEVKSALNHLDEEEDTYKLFGNFLVKVDHDTTQEELEKKKTVLQQKIETLQENQEEAQEKIETLQNQIMQEREG